MNTQNLTAKFDPSAHTQNLTAKFDPSGHTQSCGCGPVAIKRGPVKQSPAPAKRKVAKKTATTKPAPVVAPTAPSASTVTDPNKP